MVCIRGSAGWSATVAERASHSQADEGYDGAMRMTSWERRILKRVPQPAVQPHSRNSRTAVQPSLARWLAAERMGAAAWLSLASLLPLWLGCWLAAGWLAGWLVAGWLAGWWPVGAITRNAQGQLALARVCRKTQPVGMYTQGKVAWLATRRTTTWSLFAEIDIDGSGTLTVG